MRVCLSRVAHALLIAPHLAGFAKECPEVELELGLSDGISDIVGEGYDVGLRLDERLAQDMVAVPVGGDQRMVIVGSPAYFRAHPKPQMPADLLSHSCIRLRFVSSRRMFRFCLSRDGQEFDVDVRGRLLLNDMVPIVETACAGVGLAQVFEGLAREHLARRRLVRVLDVYSAPFPGFYFFYFYYPSRAPAAARARVPVVLPAREPLSGRPRAHVLRLRGASGAGPRSPHSSPAWLRFQAATASAWRARSAASACAAAVR